MQIKRLITKLDLKSRSKNEEILNKILKELNKTRKKNEDKKILLTDIASGELTKLLTLLEDKKKNNRKISLLILGILLSHNNSKFYLSEKCGLGLIKGIIFLTRLKYLYINEKEKNKKKCILFLKNLKKQEKIVKEDNLFSYLCLKNKNWGNVKEIENFKILDIKEFNENIILDNIPDPITNLCYINLQPEEEDIIKGSFLKNFKPTKKKSLGFFLDLKEKSSKKKISRKIIKRIIPNTSRSRDKSIPDTRDMTSKSITRRIKNFENTKLKTNKRFNFKKEISKSKEKNFGNKIESKYSIKKNGGGRVSNFLTGRKKKGKNMDFYRGSKVGYSPIISSFNIKKKNPEVYNKGGGDIRDKLFNFSSHKPN